MMFSSGRSRIYRYLLDISISLLTITLLAGCSSEEQADTSEIIRPAKLLEIKTSGSSDYISFPAVISSRQLTALTFQVSGKVESLGVREAQPVKKGDILAKLNDRDLLAQLKSAQSQFENTKQEFERAERLIKEDAISRSEYEKRKSNLDADKSKLVSAEKALQNAILIAPYDGAISKILIKKDQFIQAGNNAIKILGTGGLEASINLPSYIMANVQKQNDPTTDLYLILDAAPDHKVSIAFKEASLEADTSSQTYEIKFSFEAPEGINILPGMNAIIWVRNPATRSTDAKIKIPLQSIMQETNQKYVWAVDMTSMKISRKNITVEEGVGEALTVTRGLNSGDVIVIAGVSSLSEGMTVRPWVQK